MHDCGASFVAFVLPTNHVDWHTGYHAYCRAHDRPSDRSTARRGFAGSNFRQLFPLSRIGSCPEKTSESSWQVASVGSRPAKRDSGLNATLQYVGSYDWTISPQSERNRDIFDHKLHKREVLLLQTFALLASWPFWLGLPHSVRHYGSDVSLDRACARDERREEPWVQVMTTRHIILIFVPICVVTLWGCSTQVNPSQIAGRYEAHHENGFETLDLRLDGTYKHEFTAKDGAKSMSSHRWKFELFEGEPKVALYEFTPRFPRSQSGVVLLGVQKGWGRIRLYRSYDLGQYYVKTGL